MKTRQGLVSNSSTSSFVIVGYKLECNYRNKKRIVEIAKMFGQDISEEEADPDVLYNISNEQHDGFDILLDEEDEAIYVGILIADVHSDGDSLENKEFVLNDIALKCTAAKIKLFLSEEPKLYTGTRAC